MGRIRYRTIDLESDITPLRIENETGAFEELVDEFARMQAGLGCYVTDAWDDDGTHVYNADDATYERFARFADDALDDWR